MVSCFSYAIFRKEGCRWQVLGTWYQSIKTTCETALHGWRSGARAGAGRQRRFTLIWTTPFIQRTGRGLQRYRPPTHGPLWYGFHHQSEDGKYLIMGNGSDAFAIPAQQESPIKAAEMTTEQNYNMIDGVLNNAPTMSELEAKAKAGEQISLFDVAEAAKAEAQKPKQPQRPAQKQKKPSIRAQLKAAKEEQQKKPPQREKAQELEV